MKLYELAPRYAELLDMADSLDESIFQDTLSAIEEAIEDKAENIAKLIRSLEADAKAIKEEEDRLKARRMSLENKIANIKSYLQNQMEVAGIEKVKRPTISIYFQNNPPSVDVLDESLIPEDYLIPQPAKVDKKAILAALKDGFVIEGCSLKQGRSVRIR